MSIEKILDILSTVVGLYSLIEFRYVGRKAIEQRIWLNRHLPKSIQQSEKDFGKSAILFSQILCFVVGLVIFISGLAKLFS